MDRAQVLAAAQALERGPRRRPPPKALKGQTERKASAAAAAAPPGGRAAAAAATAAAASAHVGTFDFASVLEVLMPDCAGGTMPDALVLPGGDDRGSGEGGSAGFFHLDSAGMACFSAAEAAASSALLADSGFLDQLLVRIRTTEFDLPQRAEEASTHFCNEAVYGKLTLLQLAGVVRLDAGAAERAAARKRAAAAELEKIGAPAWDSGALRRAKQLLRESEGSQSGDSGDSEGEGTGGS